MAKCFVTGGSGFIGRFLVSRLLEKGHEVTVLLRNPHSCKARRASDFWEVSLEKNHHVSLLKIVRGDISSEDIVEQQINLNSFDHIYHLAAIYDLNSQTSEVVETNVTGTKNILEWSKTNGFKGCFHFLSSIAVAGDFEGVFSEEMFDEGQTHHHIYHKTKYESEQLVRSYVVDSQFSIKIYRPSAVVGHSKTGEADKVDGPYYLFLLTSLIKKVLPRWAPLAAPAIDGSIDIVPVDFVVDALVELSMKETGEQKCFHLTNPASPTINELFKLVLKSADGPKVTLTLPLNKLKKLGIGRNQVKLLSSLKAIDILVTQLSLKTGIPGSIFSAMMPGVQFSSDTTSALLSESAISVPKLENYIDRLWDYYNRHLDPDKQMQQKLSSAFEGKIVLITGGSSGIGLASAKRSLEAGASVILVSRHEDKLKEAKNTLLSVNSDYSEKIDCYSCDISDFSQCDRLIDTVLERYSKIDILFSNAGRSIRRTLIKNPDRFHDLERTMQLNYFGAARLILGFLPSMLDNPNAQVIHSSSMGTMAVTPRFGPYMSSKIALDSLMDSLAAESANTGVTFTSIKFPLVKTDMVAPTKEYRHASLASTDFAAQMFVDAVINRPRKQMSGMGKFLGSMSLYFPEVVTQIYNYLFQIWPDEEGEFADAALDRALLTSLVPNSPL